MTMTLQTGSD